MQFKTVLFIAVIIGSVYIYESEASHGLHNANIPLVPAPHAHAHAAHINGANIHAAHAIHAARAQAQAAAAAAVAAPLLIAKKTHRLKAAGGHAAVKAIKLAKLASHHPAIALHQAPFVPLPLAPQPISFII